MQELTEVRHIVTATEGNRERNIIFNKQKLRYAGLFENLGSNDSRGRKISRE